MDQFPHPSYSQHVLQPSFEMAQAHLFWPMLRAHQAHAVMLARQGIIPAEKGARLLLGLAKIEADGQASFGYQAGVEDLFFAIEQRLIGLTGPEIGGDLQLARSRNDLGAALHRIVVRDEVLRLAQALDALRETILRRAEEHIDTVMPGYTHTQPAQPTTFAHYLGGVLAALERDARRLRAAYATTNLSPLGCAAFTTTSFHVDRALVADLLGFDELLPNGQDAIGAADYALELASCLMTIGSHLSRMTNDLLFWCTQEANAIRIDDAFIQISSIMPQKRNPVVLEHLRARIAQVYGGGSAILTLVHNCPYGDTQDVEDELMMPLLQLTGTAWGILDLYTAVWATLAVNRDHLLARAAAGFTTATELADTLVRDHGVAFRSAHAIVASLVQTALSAGRSSAELRAADVVAAALATIGHPLEITDTQVQAALDPVRFVERRTIVGGPAQPTMRASLAEAGTLLHADRKWTDERRQALATADEQLRTAVARLRAAAHAP